MAEAIHIPSPSAFLRPSPPPAAPSASTPASNQRRRPASASASSSAAATGAGDSNHARGPSPNPEATPRKKQKKPAPPPNPRRASGNAAGIEKPKQSKSRNGCQTCKAKRLKCDEEKPECRQCKKRNVTCGGYKKDFKWRPFEETNVKINIDRQNQAVVRQRAKSPSTEISATTTPVTEVPPAVDVGDGFIGSSWHSPDSATAHPGQRATSQPRPRSSGSARGRANRDSAEVAEPAPPPLAPPTPPAAHSRSSSGQEDLPHQFDEILQFDNGAQDGQGAKSPERSASPTLTDILAPFSDDSPDAINIDMLDDDSPPIMMPPFDMDSNLMEGDFEQIVMDVHPPHAMHSRQNASLSDSLGMLDLALRPRTYGMYRQPFVSDTSTEALTWRFLNLTCGVLSIIDGPSENPWRTEIWAMAQQSPALYNAVTAMAAFHAAYDMPQMRMIGQEHKHASLQFLQEGLSNHTIRDETAIACALVLGFGESWEQHTASGNTHIKGAQALVKRLLIQHRVRPLQGDALRRLKFLCNAWVYMDVIARLTAVDSDDSNDFDNAFLYLDTPTSRNNGNRQTGMDDGREDMDGPDGMDDHGDSMMGRDGMILHDNMNTRDGMMGRDDMNGRDGMGGHDGINARRSPNASGFGINLGLPVDTRLDPLMGCAGTLFPLIGRVANLVRRVCRSVANSPSIISTARDLKQTLEVWEPPSIVDEPEDPSIDVEHTIQTAEAYRWATMLHLHQAVPELPSPPAGDLAQRVLQYLATVPPESRTVVVHVYPLMVAGCEAGTSEDRQWVRERWERMNQRMHLGIVEKSATVTEEVWRRRDAYEAQPTKSRRLVATADLQSLRRPGPPLVRTDTGSWGGDPGRTGMVFSYVDAGGECSAAAAPAPYAAPYVAPMWADISMPDMPFKLPGFGGSGGGGGGSGSGSGNFADNKKRDMRRSRIVDPAYTVRGHLHWVGVMWDWGWEILLG